MKKLMLQVALLSMAALAWARSEPPEVVLANAPKVYGHMTHYVLLLALAVLIILHFVSRRRALA